MEHYDSLTYRNASSFSSLRAPRESAQAAEPVQKRHAFASDSSRSNKKSEPRSGDSLRISIVLCA